MTHPDRPATPRAAARRERRARRRVEQPAADPTPASPEPARPGPEASGEPSPDTTDTETAAASAPSTHTLLASVDPEALMDELVIRLLGERPHLDPDEIAEAADVSRDVSRKLWRAMGLADVPDEVRAFTDFDLDALERTKTLLGKGDVDLHLIIQLARTLGLATARIADSVVDFTLDRLAADLVPGATCSGDADPGALPAEGTGLIELLLEELDELIVYLLHRHLVDATARRLATVTEGASSAHMVVGFADLVGYTALSQELPDQEIVELVDHFGATASNEVVGSGGRIIKMIGDEVMFSSSEEAGPEVALRLAESFTDPDLPTVRVGLASGAVLSRSGDLYGPVVNLAARATTVAHPGTVVVSPSLRDRLQGDDRYDLRRLRPRRLKGIGLVELSALRRARTD